jgi:hypothetical protein
MVMEVTATISAPDGRSRTLETSTELASEILALGADDSSRTRVTVVRDERKLDGAAKPRLAGTFELTERMDGSVDVIRLDSPISQQERDLFSKAHHPSTIASAAARRFVLRNFKVGEVLDLTADEISGLNFRLPSVRLTVTEVRPAAVVFEIVSEGQLADVGTLKAHGTMRLGESTRELDQDGQIIRDGNPVGRAHIVQRSRVY